MSGSAHVAARTDAERPGVDATGSVGPSDETMERWRQALSQAGQTGLSQTIRPSERDVEPGAAEGDAAGRGRQRDPALEDAAGQMASRDRYFLGTMLGIGGMGVVVKAIQRSLGRQVAVKIARCDLGARQRERFRTEARCTAWLEHPNIVPVYDAGGNFLVMRRIVGDDLEKALASRRLDLAATVEILIKVCDAVSFAHHRGIIHRDIKPENILVGRFGEVVLTDWGLALTCVPPEDGQLRAPAIDEAGTQLCAGTPCYMAPEIALSDRRSIGFATDVFLLGASLYRCLGGEPPFSGRDALQAIERSAENGWRRLGAVGPRRLIALQERAMMADPRDRPTVEEFQAGLRDWLLRSRAEVEAGQELAAARRHHQAALRHRLRPHEAYGSFSEAIAACDRALALDSDQSAVHELRESITDDFSLAAVGAGEPQLARLVRNGGRMPVARPAAGGIPGAPACRAVRLLPSGDQTGPVAEMMRSQLCWRHEGERLGREVGALRAEAELLRAERESLLGRCAAAGAREGTLGHRLRLVAILAAVLAIVLPLAIWLR